MHHTSLGERTYYPCDTIYQEVYLKHKFEERTNRPHTGWSIALDNFQTTAGNEQSRRFDQDCPAKMGTGSSIAVSVQNNRPKEDCFGGNDQKYLAGNDQKKTKKCQKTLKCRDQLGQDASLPWQESPIRLVLKCCSIANSKVSQAESVEICTRYDGSKTGQVIPC